ncbi:hypothetical protein GW924_00715 [Candidatus Pacearchaeota archaeon]|nr:hypothetical protein [Candidatus Pacearchaeota archaeon]
MESLDKLKEENMQLRKALAVCMNVSLIKKLSEAVERINNGEYISEEEFFSDSVREDA